MPGRQVRSLRLSILVDGTSTHPTKLLNLPEFILKSRQPCVVIFQSRSNVGPPFGFARFPQRIAQSGEV